MSVRATVQSANQPGAIGLIQLHGQPQHLEALTASLCQCPLPEIGAIQLARFADIDQGLLARITDDVLQLMPHGGPRIMQRLRERLIGAGVLFPLPSQGGGQWVGGAPGSVSNATARSDVQPPHPSSARGACGSPGSLATSKLYSEADTDIQAAMLAALARAQSPAAIDLLLHQPQRWAAFQTDPDTRWTAEDELRSSRLNRLIDPPIVVLAGPANVGKSTLSNALLGRSMSIAIDMPGTTRDYTAGRIDLAGLVVWWHDTPGFRESEDSIERESIRIARDLMQRADLLIAMTDHQNPWPVLPCAPDLRIANKADQHPAGDARPAHLGDAELRISAATGRGIATLVSRIRETLVTKADIASARPWRFDDDLTHA